MIVMQVKYKVTADKVIQTLRAAPRGVRVAFMRAVATYIIGDGRHGLKHYPAYKHITRRQAYGKPFKSEKQRKKVMAMIRRGEITPGYPRRTGNYQRSIQMKDSNDWRRVQITGTLPHKGWPNRLARMVGWRDWPTIIKSNLAGAVRSGRAAVGQWLRSKK